MIENEPAEVDRDAAQLEGWPVLVVNRATVSLTEAAGVLGIHRTTAWSLHKRGEFPVPVLKVGTNLRVVKAHLQRFMETGEPVAPGTRVNAPVVSSS